MFMEHFQELCLLKTCYFAWHELHNASFLCPDGQLVTPLPCRSGSVCQSSTISLCAFEGDRNQWAIVLPAVLCSTVALLDSVIIAKIGTLNLCFAKFTGPVCRI